MYASSKIYYYLKSVGVASAEDQIRIRNMFIYDSEDYFYALLLNRHKQITKSEFIVSMWEQFKNYVDKNKPLYFKYIKNVNKNQKHSC